MLDKTIILDGFSKTYSMTGWRLGYGVMPKWLADAVNLLTVNSNSCTASFTQRAGIAALEGPQDGVAAMVAEFRKRRDVMVKGLNEIPGFRCTVPAGAFYAFPNVTGTKLPTNALADLLLNEAGVACLAGNAFGRHGDGFLRFSYANSLPNILEAIDRIRNAVTSLGVSRRSARIGSSWAESPGLSRARRSHWSLLRQSRRFARRGRSGRSRTRSSRQGRADPEPELQHHLPRSAAHSDAGTRQGRLDQGRRRDGEQRRGGEARRGTGSRRLPREEPRSASRGRRQTDSPQHVHGVPRTGSRDAAGRHRKNSGKKRSTPC